MKKIPWWKTTDEGGGWIVAEVPSINMGDGCVGVNEPYYKGVKKLKRDISSADFTLIQREKIFQMFEHSFILKNKNIANWFELVSSYNIKILCRVGARVAKIWNPSQSNFKHFRNSVFEWKNSYWLPFWFAFEWHVTKWLPFC